jgi:hypothetical protein
VPITIVDDDDEVAASASTPALASSSGAALLTPVSSRPLGTATQSNKLAPSAKSGQSALPVPAPPPAPSVPSASTATPTPVPTPVVVSQSTTTTAPSPSPTPTPKPATFAAAKQARATRSVGGGIFRASGQHTVVGTDGAVAPVPVPSPAAESWVPKHALDEDARTPPMSVVMFARAWASLSAPHKRWTLLTVSTLPISSFLPQLTRCSKFRRARSRHCSRARSSRRSSVHYSRPSRPRQWTTSQWVRGCARTCAHCRACRASARSCCCSNRASSARRAGSWLHWEAWRAGRVSELCARCSGDGMGSSPFFVQSCRRGMGKSTDSAAVCPSQPDVHPWRGACSTRLSACAVFGCVPPSRKSRYVCFVVRLRLHAPPSVGSDRMTPHSIVSTHRLLFTLEPWSAPFICEQQPEFRGRALLITRSNGQDSMAGGWERVSA